MIRRREIGERLAHHPAHSGLGQRAAHLGLEIIHVGHAGHAAPDHLERGKTAANPHHAGVDTLPLQRQDIAVEPVIHILAQTPEQGHRHMAMAVHHARQDQIAAHVERTGIRRSASPHARDNIALQPYPAIGYFGHGAIHRQDPRIAQRKAHASSFGSRQHWSGCGTSTTSVPGSKGSLSGPFATSSPAAVSQRY